MSVARDELSVLICDMLAIQTAKELERVVLPTPEDMNALRKVTKVAADRLLDGYTEGVLSEKVRHLIIADVRDALLKRTRLSSFIGWGLIVSSFVSAALIGAAQLVFVMPVDVEALKAVYWIILLVLVVQFLGFAYLRYLDQSP